MKAIRETAPSSAPLTLGNTVAACQVVDGTLEPGMSIVAASTGKKFQVQEIGLLSPARKQVGALSAGQVGYVIAGMKSTKEALVGDTFCDASVQVCCRRKQGWCARACGPAACLMHVDDMHCGAWPAGSAPRVCASKADGVCQHLPGGLW